MITLIAKSAVETSVWIHPHDLYIQYQRALNQSPQHFIIAHSPNPILVFQSRDNSPRSLMRGKDPQ